MSAYIVEAVLLVLVLAAFVPIVREEWQGRGVFRWHGEERVDVTPMPRTAVGRLLFSIWPRHSYLGLSDEEEES